MASEKEKNPTIEESFDELDAIVARLEDEKCPLEESFALYEKGMKLVKQLNESIDKVENRLKIITGESDEGSSGDE